MEKRSRRRIRDLVARPASLGLSENEIGCARISMMARNTNVPFKGRIQKRKTYHLQIITFRLQRAAGPYRSAITGCEQSQQVALFNHLVGALLEEQRNIEAERLGGLGVDGHLKFGRQLDGKLRRLCATENAIDVGC
jgi:hypothetical protein